MARISHATVQCATAILARASCRQIFRTPKDAEVGRMNAPDLGHQRYITLGPGR